jgi:hypothetical protein
MQARFDSSKLQLHLASAEHYRGQDSDDLDDVPVYAHVKVRAGCMHDKILLASSFRAPADKKCYIVCM